MSDIIFEKKSHTALITLNRPDAMNALNEDFIRQINGALDQAEADPDIYTIIITGTGKSFIAGADIQEMVNQTKDEIMEWSALGSGLNLRLERLQLPVIAAINGYALGGGLELAMACDIRLASENARMGLPEVKLGVICGAGGTQRLPKLVGEGIAKELIFTGKTISAAEALEIGLINHVTQPENLLDAALDLAKEIEKNGQLAVRAAKDAVNFATNASELSCAADLSEASSSSNASIEIGCFKERELFSALFETEDQKIGMKGFLNKDKNIAFKNR